MTSRAKKTSHHIILLTTLAILASNASADTIKIGGTGAALGSMKQLGEAFEKLHPEHDIVEVPSLGSSGGIKALQSGAIQLAVSGRDLKPEERSGGLLAVRYGTTPFAFATHWQAPSLQLTKAGIADIYSGRQQNWPNGQPIRVVMRPKTEGDTLVLQKISPAIEAAVTAAFARSGMVVAITDTDSADQIEKYPDSFGTTTLALVLSERRQVKLLAVEGNMPTVSAVENGAYPYVKDLYAVVSKDAAAGTRQFMDFILSTTGRDILKKLGHKTYFPK